MLTKEQFKALVYKKAAEAKAKNKANRAIWVRSIAAFSILMVVGGVYIYSNLTNGKNAESIMVEDGIAIDYGDKKAGISYNYSKMENQAVGLVADIPLVANIPVEAENEGIPESSPMAESAFDAFSFGDASDDFASESDGIITYGFKNVSESAVENASQAIELAKNECTINYDTTKVAYDSTADIWRVAFFTDGVLGICQEVYLNGDGTTRLIVYGE